MPTPLSATSIARLKEQPFTYAEVGATLGDRLPDRYRHLRQHRRLNSSFDDAAEHLMTWQMHERAGLAVACEGDRTAAGQVVVLRLGIGRLSVTAPCRVVDVIIEPDRVGFAYGTLPGHPESGEECFVIERQGDTITVHITAFSRPATFLARASGPIARWTQDLVTARYLRALR